MGAVTGYASSFALVLAGAHAVGADPGQAASGLFVVTVGQGVLAIVVSLALRLPISIAWSTPAAAVLVGASGITGDYSAAVGAFVVTGLLLAVTGLWPWLARTMTRIPPPIASAMLAGILFPICLSPVFAAVQLPLLALPAILVWLVLARFAPRWAVPAAVLATAVAVVVAAGPDWADGVSLAPHLELVAPSFDPLVVIALAIPLYLVTMAGQNIPGFTVLRSYGYEPPARTVLTVTGLGSTVFSVFGAQTINLSALSAAIMVGDEHTPKDRRWIATVTAGTVYVLLGLGAGVAGALVTASPPILIESVAGLALIGALTTAVVGALAEPEGRVVAVGTFLVVASGVAIAGLGSAFWGLVVGAVLWLVLRVGRRAAA
ncbi:MAG: benzoate/H(+) symporter BenE family transporter [Actinomycetales bacterium]|nr:benzoate/H(+) symporter BenE family transporter [Actinomycetales bacterium]